MPGDLLCLRFPENYLRSKIENFANFLPEILPKGVGSIFLIGNVEASVVLSAVKKDDIEQVMERVFDKGLKLVIRKSNRGYSVDIVDIERDEIWIIRVTGINLKRTIEDGLNSLNKEETSGYTLIEKNWRLNM